MRQVPKSTQVQSARCWRKTLQNKVWLETKREREAGKAGNWRTMILGRNEISDFAKQHPDISVRPVLELSLYFFISLLFIKLTPDYILINNKQLSILNYQQNHL